MASFSQGKFPPPAGLSCYYTMDSLQFKQRLLSEIRQTFGYGGLNCSFSERELSDFHNYLEKSFPYDDVGRVKTGEDCVGKQQDGS